MVRLLNSSIRRGNGLQQRRKTTKWLWFPLIFGFAVFLLSHVNILLIYDYDEAEEAAQDQLVTDIDPTRQRSSAPLRHGSEPEASEVRHGPKRPQPPISPVAQSQTPPRPLESQSTNETKKRAVHQYSVDAKLFERIDSPWQDWSKCDPQVAFQAKCHPKPATCQSTSDAV
jgi:hypothetical protein